MYFFHFLLGDLVYMVDNLHGGGPNRQNSMCLATDRVYINIDIEYVNKNMARPIPCFV